MLSCWIAMSKLSLISLWENEHNLQCYDSELLNLNNVFELFHWRITIFAYRFYISVTLYTTKTAPTLNTKWYTTQIWCLKPQSKDEMWRHAPFYAI